MTSNGGTAAPAIAPPEAQALVIAAPDLRDATFSIRGTSPYVQNRFSVKALEQMRTTQQAGSTARTKRKRSPKQFDELYESAMYKSGEGWRGIPAPTFRNAAISACRIAGYVMTRAKLSVFTIADGVDHIDATPLVRITSGLPEKSEMLVRLETGVADIRVRPMWKEWTADVRMRWDGGQFTLTDITNLLSIVGQQVGIGEGRYDSKKSNGLGWGCFEIVSVAHASSAGER
jgi:hypothetical protein